MDKKRDLQGRLALLVTTLIWGSSFVILKSTLDTITPLWLLSIRFCGAAIVMLALCYKKIRLIDRQHIKGGVLMGVFLSAAYTVQTYGLVYTTPGKNAFLTASYCIIVPFLYWLISGKKPDKFNISAAIVCIVGMGFVCLNNDLTVNIGDILTICCGLFYALHIITTAKSVDGRDPLLLTVIQFITAGIVCLVFAALFEPTPKAIPASSVWSIAYLVIMCTGVCYILQTFGQKYTPPAAASVLLSLESVFGTVISIAIGQENLTVSIVLGFILIFTAVLISETKLEFLRKKADT